MAKIAHIKAFSAAPVAFVAASLFFSGILKHQWSQAQEGATAPLLSNYITLAKIYFKLEKLKLEKQESGWYCCTAF